MREGFVRTGMLVATLFVAVLLAPASTARAADVTVTFSLFHDRLAPYGEWVSVSRYGSCWRPRRVARTWRPYTAGHWVYTDYGWTWVSDEDWGWATYHYGRWVDDPDYGWIWVPDETWGPAYVSWRYGDGWIGWAPLPVGVGLSVSADIDRYVRPSAYSFVQMQHFSDPRVRTYIVADARNVSLIPVTRNVTRYDSGGGRVVDRGVDPREVERASGHRVTQLQVRDSADPRASHARVANNALTVFRPAAANREAHPAAQSRQAARPAPARAQREEAPNHARGTTGRVVPEPHRTTESPTRRSERQQSPERARPAPHAAPPAQRSHAQERAPQSAQQPRAAHPPRAARQPQAAPQRGTAPRAEQHSRTAERPSTPAHQQPGPVATSGRRASKPAAAHRPPQAPKKNEQPPKDKPKEKKKGGE